MIIMHLMYRMPVIIIPVVVGYAGIVSTNCITHLSRIPEFRTIYFLSFRRQSLLEMLTFYDGFILNLYIDEFFVILWIYAIN